VLFVYSYYLIMSNTLPKEFDISTFLKLNTQSETSAGGSSQATSVTPSAAAAGAARAAGAGGSSNEQPNISPALLKKMSNEAQTVGRKRGVGLGAIAKLMGRKWRAKSAKVDNVRVLARFRPMAPEEEAKGKQAPSREQELFIQYGDDSRYVQLLRKDDDASQHQFSFDRVFQPSSTQQEVFESMGKDTVHDVVRGFNGTIFAYGQTGSGKTYSMFGGQDWLSNDSSVGVIPRAANMLFDELQRSPTLIRASLKVWFIEIYQERVRDLLHGIRFKSDLKKTIVHGGTGNQSGRREAGVSTATVSSAAQRNVASRSSSSSSGDSDSKNKSDDLRVRETPSGGVYVEDLIKVEINNADELRRVIRAGSTNRKQDKTHMNAHSVRVSR
jgi:Kinesin motor domain